MTLTVDTTAAPPLLLQTSDISKDFAGVTVLEKVQFDLRPGEVHILAGENGAGKSTLIKIIAGVHTEYSGQVDIQGFTVRMKNPLDAEKYGIAVIHQEMSLVPSMSVADNIFLGRENTHAFGWLNHNYQKQQAHEILRELGLEGINVSLPLEEYPISVQQMIEIAKALALKSRIIIMDEPTSALTDPEVEKLFAIIDQLKAKGCGIIYITHKMEEIYRIADRITVLRDGKYIGTADAEDLPANKLVNWMVGREITEQFPPRTGTPGAVSIRLENFSVPNPGQGAKWLAHDVSLEARAGEIIGLAGLQGSGNSALLQGIFGAYGPIAHGRVFLNDKPYTISHPRHAINSGVALLTSDRKATGLVLGMNITRNITLAALDDFSPGGWLKHGQEVDAAQKHREALRIKADRLEQEVNSLSGGNQQKVALAKWLQTKPRVLLLDEPTRGVDIGAKAEIYRLMNQWTSEGVTILLITSEMPELLAMSDRIYVMSRGKVTAHYQRGDATQEKILHAAMGHDIGLN
ncbi:MAG: sugar ABC transporter ATP-binding protein [Sedimentisphaerales bacterium]|nr:sugar ABC transporter ATP-binding protein [Sedimentisphaerales bacterium]